MSTNSRHFKRTKYDNDFETRVPLAVKLLSGLAIAAIAACSFFSY